jgi:hypothetical protein
MGLGLGRTAKQVVVILLLHRMSPVLADFVAKVFLHWGSKILRAVDATFV